MLDKLLKNKIRKWWNDHPQTYQYIHGEFPRDVKIGSRKFYENIDRDFIKESVKIGNYPFADYNYPIFDKVIHYRNYKGKKVLEMGCGLGNFAQQFSEMGCLYCGIDIAKTAVNLTQQRLRTFELKSNIVQADAEKPLFKDKIFDLIFSWGVLHHTPGTRAAIDQIYRILKDNGKAIIMLYNKRSMYYFFMRILDFFRKEPFHKEIEITSYYTDGRKQGGNPYTKLYTPDEVRAMFSKFSKVDIQVFGYLAFDIFFPTFDRLIPKPIKKYLGRRWGWMQLIYAKK